ncbi:Mg2+ transporter protein [Lactobacillus phage LfeInf]|uniref:Mg2+ transporter protein n=1 Tax=Lactobacillus phage LfeInf TaxID=1567484 RepID=A0A0A7NTZ0_9CAUD|nr:Mg2+ transporter protein [Lactobacillus phage LfeInf]AIZ94642.1 Mg2+ transporter protein [Lactobacillus phage LfeInf]
MQQLYKIRSTHEIENIKGGDYDWLEITKPDDSDLSLVQKRTGLEISTSKLILSSHESSHIEGLTEPDKPLMIVLQYPKMVESNLGDFKEYATSPIILILSNDGDNNDLITISNHEPSFIAKIQEDSKSLKVPITNKKDIMLLVIYYMSQEYRSILRSLNKDANSLEQSLKTATNNIIFYHVMSIQKTVSSFLDSLANNQNICEKIENDANYFASEKYTELARSASLALEETSEAARHLDYILDKYTSLVSSIVGNNQLVTINKFTEWGIVLSFLSASFGALGMNYYLPGESSHVTTILVFATIFASSIWLSKYIRKLLKGKK